jgi:hypothetical protein
VSGLESGLANESGLVSGLANVSGLVSGRVSGLVTALEVSVLLMFSVGY